MNIYKRPFDDQRQMRFRLETVAITMIFASIDDGQLSARWSFVLDYENSRDPIRAPGVRTIPVAVLRDHHRT
jgi:hypothetical protein